MPLKFYTKIPSSPGVYIMKNGKGEILYIGKAVNLKRRVSSYFQKAHEHRIEKLVSQIKKIDYQETGSGLEALILESALIKKHQPPFNVLEKDDKSFLYVQITKEKFPRVLLVRGKDIRDGSGSVYFGPFISSSALKDALKIIRRIFPYNTHDPATRFSRACFDYSIRQCPGTCIGIISQKNYAKTIKNLKLFFRGKKHQILKSLEKEMKQASKDLEFEKAGTIRRQIFALKHIEDIAFIADSDISSQKTPINNSRIEGYDISNISGASAVGSMVVFVDGKPNKNEYRKFKIQSLKGPDDTGMLKEILARRFEHKDWFFPNLILIDGGVGQVNAAKSVLANLKIKIPILGIVKGHERKRNDIIGLIPGGIEKKTLIRVRDEAHRFALNYYRKLHSRNMLK